MGTHDKLLKLRSIAHWKKSHDTLLVNSFAILELGVTEAGSMRAEEWVSGGEETSEDEEGRRFVATRESEEKHEFVDSTPSKRIKTNPLTSRGMLTKSTAFFKTFAQTLSCLLMPSYENQMRG